MQAAMPLLRPATEADAPQIIAMDQAIFGEYGAAEAPNIICARLAVFPAGCAVLEEEATTDAPAKLLGYLTTEKWEKVREPALDEDPYQTHKPNGHVLNITTLAVGRMHQKRGLGERLLQQAIAIARSEECTEIILETARAEQFYQRHSFETVGERQQRGITLYIMRFSLSAE